VTDEELFELIVDAPAGERAALFDRHCAGYPELRRRIEALLRDLEPDERTPIAAPADDVVGAVIVGRYTLVEPIGQGGMGQVWIAKQTEPVKRKVALKLIRAELGSRTVLARFEQERQALALMDHPNIARVFDGGVTDRGRPFLVMELVPGRPLTKFCDEAKLGVRERLDLFIQVCRAVQHAHQKGVVHRDLKPANILVTLVDGRPTPKVIDFGVAKAIGGRLIEETLSTQFGALVGTLEYMAPEQAGVSVDDVDTRADVYALGVVLYELLTGLRPFDSARLRRAALDEVIRVIKEEEPQSLSSRLSADQSLASAAAVRGLDPHRLLAMMKGELDWIALRCLEKDRNRRYESASGLARDVERFLNDEAVEARPVSAAYRFRKLVRRHRGPAVALLAVFATLVLGVAGTTWGLFEARRQEDDARKQQKRAEKGEELAEKRLGEVEAEKRRVEEERRVAISVRDFLQLKLLRHADVFYRWNPLQSGAPEEQPTLNPTVRELLDRAADELSPARIETSFPKQPRLQAELLQTVGLTYLGIGDGKRSIDFLRRSFDLYRATLGDDHPDALTSMHCLARAYQDAKNLDEALRAGGDAFKRREAALGKEHPDTVASMESLATIHLDAGNFDAARSLMEKGLALVKARHGPDHAETLKSMNNLAYCHLMSRNVGEAIPVLEELVALRRAKSRVADPDAIASMNNLAGAYKAAGKLAESLKLLEEVLPLSKSALGPDHPRTLTSMNNLAGAYGAAGRFAEAFPLYEEALRLRKTKRGPEHYDTLISMYNLAYTYREARKFDKSIELFTAVLKLFEKTMGRDCLETQRTAAWLGRTYKDVGRLTDAIPLLEEAHRNATKHPTIDWTGFQLLDAYSRAGRRDATVKLADKLARQSRQSWPAESADLATEIVSCGVALLQASAYAEAEPYLREAHAIRLKLEPRAFWTFNTKSLLGLSLLKQKKFAEAEPHLLQAYEGIEERNKAEPTSQLKSAAAAAAGRIVELYVESDRPALADKWRAEQKKHAAPPANKK
jgi:tetratricopeptide (TPR) repeat protein